MRGLELHAGNLSKNTHLQVGLLWKIVGTRSRPNASLVASP